jgi:hypothetical protein
MHLVDINISFLTIFHKINNVIKFPSNNILYLGYELSLYEHF